MRLINIIDKQHAEHLKSFGFKCIEKIIDNKVVFQFIEEPGLVKELNSNFEEGSYFYTNNMTF